MSDHMTCSLDELKTQLLEDGVIDADEVTKLRERLYADGIIDSDEADFLFELNDAVSGKENAAEWTDFFVEAISDYVLKDDESPGVVDDSEAAALIAKIKSDGVVDDTEMALLVNLMSAATSCSESLCDFTVAAAKTRILQDGIIDADEVTMLSTIIFGAGGAGGEGVSRTEADFLFELNDAVSGKENAAEWTDFFVKAIASHVLEDEQSPGEIDDAEADWLIAKIEGDGEYDAVEMALLQKIKVDASSMPDKLSFKLQMVNA